MHSILSNVIRLYLSKVISYFVDIGNYSFICVPYKLKNASHKSRV